MNAPARSGPGARPGGTVVGRVPARRWPRRRRASAGPRWGWASCLATRRRTLPRPSSRPGTTTSLGRPCCGSWRSAVAMACGSRPRRHRASRPGRALRAARVRMNCSSRGRVRGTMSARLSKRQDLAEGVVAAHRDHAGGALHQGAEIVGEGERADVAELRRALLEGLARSGRHERPEHDHRAVGHVRIVLVGRSTQSTSSSPSPPPPGVTRMKGPSISSISCGASVCSGSSRRR